MSFDSFYSSCFELATVWVPDGSSEEQTSEFLRGVFDYIAEPT
eukprot:COSAG01_NODE_19103_length_1030_cov_24.420726_1_plen_42_part_10